MTERSDSILRHSIFCGSLLIVVSYKGSQVQGSKVTTDEHCSPYYYRFGIPADPIGLKGFINAIKTELL
jgi:hypothetical protein